MLKSSQIVHNTGSKNEHLRKLIKSNSHKQVLLAQTTAQNNVGSQHQQNKNGVILTAMQPNTLTSITEARGLNKNLSSAALHQMQKASPNQQLITNMNMTYS